MVIRGRDFNDREIKLIKGIVTENRNVSRRQLSILICEKLHWRQPNGLPKDRACRDVLLRLAAKNIIKLPSPRYTLSTQPFRVYSPETFLHNVHLQGKVDDFGPLHFAVVSTLTERRLWNYLIAEHHYLGISARVGRHLKLFLYLENQLVGAMSFADAVLKLKLRDRWIGWTSQRRSDNLPRIINNTRFLISPSVKVKNLASKTLALAAKTVPYYWQRFYHFKPVLMESFIEKDRFNGSSYRAANWIFLGETVGKARSGMKYYQHGVKKHYYVYPIVKNACQILQGGGA